PDPRHPRDQPRPDLPPDGAARQRPGGVGPRHPERVPQPGQALRQHQGPVPARGEGAGHVGVLPARPGVRPVQARPGGRLGHQAQAHRVLRPAALAAAEPPQGGPHRPAVPRRQPRAGPLLPAPGPRHGRAGDHRRGHRRGGRDAAADDPGPPAGPVHPPGQGAQARLHRRLGPPEAERPGAAHRAVQGPVQGPRRAGRAPDRQPLTAAVRPAAGTRRGRYVRRPMPSYVTATVTEVLSERPGLQRVVTDAGRAYVLTDVVGPVTVGDQVVLNTTAVELGLGTGGWHVVHWNLARDAWSRPGGGHIMKVRYTSRQHDAGAAEEHHPDLTSTVRGLPVVVCSLHSQVGVVAAVARHLAPEARIAYVMTDGAALPLALSDLVQELRTRGIVDTTVTAGHAFGGDLEAVAVPSALALARHVAGADLVVVGM